jgi:hypothetical protein
MILPHEIIHIFPFDPKLPYLNVPMFFHLILSFTLWWVQAANQIEGMRGVITLRSMFFGFQSKKSNGT